ncbi:VOC family protein [Mycobacterium genavense]|uniref:VOC family protein n=1 Tax=Mycobacterium genavense TaxID=36812 RepID=UPI0004BA3D66|nr:VOC family protein [Mycobacterium genavense]
MSPSASLARRFLHVNLNCASLASTELLYCTQLGLLERMRTDPSVMIDGSILGLDRGTYCTTAFLYDALGARRGCALETIEYRIPALEYDHERDPARPGIRSLLLMVSDPTVAAARLTDRGFAVGEPGEGLISNAESVLVTDPDGVVIELSQARGQPCAVFAGIRIAAIDAAATGKFLCSIGFEQTEEITAVPVTGYRLDPGAEQRSTQCLLARYALPEDAHQFSVVVVQHPDTVGREPVPWGGNRQGLYRCALRVDSVDDALAALPGSVQACGDPVWCPLPVRRSTDSRSHSCARPTVWCSNSSSAP